MKTCLFFSILIMLMTFSYAQEYQEGKKITQGIIKVKKNKEIKPEVEKVKAVLNKINT